jgi:hypothetical protein
MKIGKQLCRHENELILAWRVWLHGDQFINKERKPILHSVGLNNMGGVYGRSECPWPVGKANEYPYLFKECGADGGRDFDGSRGGIYAYKSYRAAIRDTCHLPGQNIWGAVWLWGKVFEHKYGYRALFAYPATVCGVGRQERLEAIAARYQISTMSVWFDEQSKLEGRIHGGPKPEAVRRACETIP